MFAHWSVVQVDGVAELSVQIALQILHLALSLVQLILLVVQLLLLLFDDLLEVIASSVLVHGDESLTHEELESALLAKSLVNGVESISHVLDFLLDLLDLVLKIAKLHVKLAEVVDLPLVVSVDVGVLPHFHGTRLLHLHFSGKLAQNY